MQNGKRIGGTEANISQGLVRRDGLKEDRSGKVASRVSHLEVEGGGGRVASKYRVRTVRR